MAATDVVFSGCSHMASQQVTVVICGLVVGPYLVSTVGTVTVPLADQLAALQTQTPYIIQDPGTYYKQYDVGPYDSTTWGDATTSVTMQIAGGGIATMYLPVYIGYPYPAMLQPLRPNTQQQTKSQTGGATGKLRRVWSVGLLVTHASGLMVGTSPSNLLPVNFQFANTTPVFPTILYDGAWYQDLNTGDDLDGMPFIYSPGPYPCVINSIVGYTELKEKT